MKLINLAQGSPEWLAFRRFKIGASDAAAVLGISPWKTPLQLWEEKINGTETAQNAAMTRGKNLEETARVFFNKLLKANFHPIVAQHDEHDWMIASLDGFDPGLNALVEIKCPSKIGEEIPAHYYAQMQHQFAVTGLEKGFYFEFIEDGVYSSTAVNRDDAYIKKLIAKEQAFEQSLRDFKPPVATDRDIVEYTDSLLVHNANTLANLQAHIKRLEADYEDLKATLVKKCEHPRVRIGNITLTKSICAGAIDYKAIPELQGLDLEKYRKKSFDKWTVKVQEEIGLTVLQVK